MDGDVGGEPIAEFTNRAVPAGTRQHDIGDTAHVRVRVGDGDAASGQTHAVEVVDVVADVNHVRQRGAALTQQAAETRGLVTHAHLERQRQLAAACPDHRV